ncbi:soc-2 suppressor of clear [Cichlidogyrus casuarinus]|uniref:Soc-2 suppressor of clear n=1 Tax=Cichlidogyrus casuarinus TaxID=1844966 RepID=A0ABD2Q5B9_9PLAT
MASAQGTGGSNSPESANLTRGPSPDTGDDVSSLVPAFEHAQITTRKKSSLVGTSYSDSKKAKVTVQRPGDQKAYQCGPTQKKSKRVESDAVKEISRCKDESSRRLDLAHGQLQSLPTSVKDLAGSLVELFLYRNKLTSLPTDRSLNYVYYANECCCYCIQGCPQMPVCDTLLPATLDPSMLNRCHTRAQLSRAWDLQRRGYWVMFCIPPSTAHTFCPGYLSYVPDFGGSSCLDPLVFTSLLSPCHMPNSLHFLLPFDPTRQSKYPGGGRAASLVTFSLKYFSLDQATGASDLADGAKSVQTMRLLAPFWITLRKGIRMVHSLFRCQTMSVCRVAMVHSLEQHASGIFLAGSQEEIGELSNLQILQLQENSITQLPDSLANCAKIRSIDLRHNKLSAIPPVVYSLRNLTHLLLTFNRIRMVEEQIAQLQALQTLTLRENKVKQLPKSPGLGALTSLRSLDLSHNSLDELPEEIGQCQNLTSLYLQHNQLNQLPERIGELTQLEHLGIRYNRFTGLPASLSRCSALLDLNIEGNSIAQLPDGLLAHLRRLTSVTLSRNQFVHFPSGGPQQFTSVQMLNMDHNQIKNIPFGIFAQAGNLTKLNLKDNQLSSLPLG